MAKRSYGSPEIPSPTVTDQDAHTAQLAREHQNRLRITSDRHAQDLAQHMADLIRTATQAAAETLPIPQAKEQPPNQNEAA